LSIEHVIQHSTTRWQQLDENGGWFPLKIKKLPVKETVE